MVKEFLRKIWRSKRGGAAKVIIDNENLFYVLKQLKKEGVEIPEILASLREFLGNDGHIKDIYFYDTLRESDLNQRRLKKELARKKVKVIMEPPKVIISGMTRKSMVDPLIIVEIMRTIQQLDYGKIFLFSGDSDFEEPLKEIKKWGIKSTVIGSRINLSRELKAVADQIIYLEELLARIPEEMVV